MPPKSSKFSDGERILCFHGPLMYEAKCIKSELRDGNKGFQYLIHYNGWNKHWDEWVPESRVLKYNDSNLQRQKDLLKQHGKDKAKRGKPPKFSKSDNYKETSETSKRSEHTPLPVEPKKKRSRLEPSVEPLDAYLSKVEVKVVIPDALKSVLINDWDLVTRQKKLFGVPAKVPIEKILTTYVENNSDSVEKTSTVQELTAGITEYFNVMLEPQLLYRVERGLHNQTVSNSSSLTMVQIYGFPHLLRLFVKIGSILAYTRLDKENLAILIKQMQAFLDYLNDNESTLFNADDYDATPVDQQKKV